MVAVALSTLIPAGKETLAVAVEAATVPESGLLETVVTAPDVGMSAT
jgi:hypothetical protein